MEPRQHISRRYRNPLMWLPVAGLLLTATVVRPAASDPPGPPPAGAHQPFNEQVLQLNPAQSKRFNDFENASRDKKHKLIDQLRDIRKQLWNVYQSYDLDVKKAKDLNRQLNKVQQDLLKLHLDEQVELRKILTADQFAKLQACMRQHDADRDKNGHRGDWGH